MIKEAQEHTRPSFRVSDSKKRAKDFEYTKKVIDYLIGCSFFIEDVVAPGQDNRDIRLFYEAYNMKLPESYFNYVTNPLNSSNADYKNWPARLRPYSIIRPNIDLLEGEYDKRPFNFVVKVNNTDAVNIAQDQEYQALLASLEQMFINELNARGAKTGQPTQEVEPPAKIKAKFSSNYKDERAIQGEAALNILIDDLALEETFKRLFKDWLVAGESYSYKGARGKDIVYERVSPLDLDYDKAPDTEYVEDGSWVVRRMFMTVPDIIDNWYDELTSQDIDIIEQEDGQYSFRTSSVNGFDHQRADDDLKRSKCEVFHVVWKYQVKIGILTYSNSLTGEIEEMEVPETYKPAEGESVEWYWINEVWEGYKLAETLYVGIQPIPNQRNVMNNLSVCKLPYNGKKFSDVHSQNISIVEMGLPYEILHRILHFQLEKTIAKSKGKILLMDINAIPKKDGWDEEKFFYWSEANGFGLVNRNQIGVDKSYNQYNVVDMGLYEHISNLIEVMEYTKTEWDELIGITRQRKGKTEASETATGVNSAVYQSSVISERVFSRFEEWIQRELMGLMDCSKLAWIDGKKRLWHGDDMRTLMFTMDPIQYSETEFGVYVSKSPRDIQSLEMVRQQVQAFAQNGMAPSTMIDVVRARSLSKLQQILREKEAESMEAQQKMNLSEQEAEERKLMIEQQFAQMNATIEKDLMEAEYDRKEDIEHIKGAYSTYKNVEGTGDNNANGIPDPVEVQRNLIDAEAEQRSYSVERFKAVAQDRQKHRELDIKEKELKQKEQEMKVKKQIEDKKASVALKNKVVGEKSKSKK